MEDEIKEETPEVVSDEQGETEEAAEEVAVEESAPEATEEIPA